MTNVLISRQDTIDLLRKRLIETANNNVGFICDAGEVFEDASERIKYWIDELPPAQPKKKLTFSERIEIAKTYREWIKSNGAAYCPESFLAYLSIEGYIDG